MPTSKTTGISQHVICIVLITSGFPVMETTNTGVFVDSLPTFHLFIRHVSIVLYRDHQKYLKPTKQPSM